MSIPKRWLNYTPSGEQITGTRFIALKVPLDKMYDKRLPPKQRFNPSDFMTMTPNVGMIIDLTDTARYYKKNDFEEFGIKHVKLNITGGMIPKKDRVNKFMNVVESFTKNEENEGQLIAVHCTHGVNRTGFLICRYMIDKLNIEPEEAIKEFQRARGHVIERSEYLASLRGEEIAEGTRFVKNDAWRLNAPAVKVEEVEEKKVKKKKIRHRKMKTEKIAIVGNNCDGEIDFTADDVFMGSDGSFTLPESRSNNYSVESKEWKDAAMAHNRYFTSNSSNRNNRRERRTEEPYFRSSHFSNQAGRWNDVHGDHRGRIGFDFYNHGQPMNRCSYYGPPSYYSGPSYYDGNDFRGGGTRHGNFPSSDRFSERRESRYDDSRGHKEYNGSSGPSGFSSNSRDVPMEPRAGFDRVAKPHHFSDSASSTQTKPKTTNSYDADADSSK